MYCPDWIFEIVSAEVASLYLKNDVPLEMGASKYVSGLSENFEEFLFFAVEKRNVGIRPKRMLAKFHVDRSHVRGEKVDVD